jgi:hypothetical protein
VRLTDERLAWLAVRNLITASATEAGWAHVARLVRHFLDESARRYRDASQGVPRRILQARRRANRLPPQRAMDEVTADRLSAWMFAVDDVCGRLNTVERHILREYGTLPA